MRRTICLAAIAAAVLAGGAGLANGAGDDPRASDRGVQAGGHDFRVVVRGDRNTIRLEPDQADFNRAGLYWADAEWRLAALTFLKPFGCAVARMSRVERAGPAWEATYYCPLGTDLPALARLQAAAKTTAPDKP